MASKVENWWAGSYPAYSIKNFESMDIFLKFRDTNRRAFVRGDEIYKEALWKVDNCDIFEWFDRSKRTGEKFGHDKNSDTWFYEHWFMEEEVHVVVKTWLNRPTEWGLVIRYYPDYEVHVTWSLSGSTKTYEENQVTKSSKKGLKEGSRQTPFGIEDFAEMFWEGLEETGIEKSWKRGSAQGGEKEYKRGLAKWGESWVEDKDYTEKREWRNEGPKNVGVYKGQKGNKTWEEKWDQDITHDIDDKTWTEGNKTWGLIKEKRPDQAFKVEWEGIKPSLGGAGEDGYAKSRLVIKLTDLYRSQKSHVEGSLETLRILTSENTTEKSEVQKMSTQFKN